MTNFSRFVGLFLLVCALSFGQTVITSTTLAAAIDGSATLVSLTSATGVNAPVFTTGVSTYLYVDKELMLVTGTTPVTTVFTVQRGFNGTSARPHIILSPVYLGAPNRFAAGKDPSGQCVRTNLPFVPIINPDTGNTFDCLGVTTAGQYVQTNSPGVPVVGSTVASATSITPTGTHFAVSGVTAVATIVVPAGFKPGMCLNIRPTGIFATTTADNIGLISSATVVGRILTMCYDGSKWWPSYVS